VNLYRDLLLKSPLVPWRIRFCVERWVEITCRMQFPAVYRMLHHGSFADRVRAITQGPQHHFFGYYDKSPWNADQTVVLAHEVSFNDRPPIPTEPVRVGVVSTKAPARFCALGETYTWNWQQGAMLQWHPANPNNWIVFNTRRGEQGVSVVMDTAGNEQAVYARPIYAIAPDGRCAYSLNFARLHRHRPGYGYAGLRDPWEADPHPAEDGLWRLDLRTGDSYLVVSLAALAQSQPKDTMNGAYHWLNHLQFSPKGSRLAFFHIWGCDTGNWAVRLYAIEEHAGRHTVVLDTEEISHYDWLDEDHILVWARHPDGDNAFLLCDLVRDRIERVGNGVLTEDGHCSFSPDRRWVLNDTYPDRYGLRTLMLFDHKRGTRIDLARLYSPKERWWGEIRCDLHPRWSPDGRYACIDSVHSGERQMYQVDLCRFVT
jgi:hypothetical protein